MSSANHQRHGITIKASKGLLRVLHSPIKICHPGGTPLHSFNGIWDTGASATVITQEVVDRLALAPIGITKVNTASEIGKETSQYIIDIYLKDDLKIKDVIVTLGTLPPGLHGLIGMDIICLGDFTITNHKQNTCMSFRVPSCFEIDFSKDVHFGVSPFTDLEPSKNSKCPCGSGKLYKRCHGQGK